MRKLLQFCHLFGLHPLVALGMFGVDFMLFGGEAGSVGVAWPVSIGVAAALTLPCVLIQRYGYRENWGLALGKGLMVGVLTAIPTPLPGLLTLVGGSVGGLSLLLGDGSTPARPESTRALPESK